MLPLSSCRSCLCRAGAIWQRLKAVVRSSCAGLRARKAERLEGLGSRLMFSRALRAELPFPRCADGAQQWWVPGGSRKAAWPGCELLGLTLCDCWGVLPRCPATALCKERSERVQRAKVSDVRK